MHQPGLSRPSESVTLQLKGTFLVSFYFSSLVACWGSIFGGRRSDNLRVVFGRRTAPALDTSGIPSIPVIDRFGLQVWFKYISSRLSCETNFTPLVMLYFVYSFLPCNFDIFLAYSIAHFGILVWNSFATLPVLVSSILDSRSQATVKVSGTIPDAKPEW